MTQDKAREYFSAYHEGSLELGLRASLERQLASDPALKSELNAYVETVSMLDAMRHEAIAPPAYLNDRIAARLQGARDLTPPRPFWADWFTARPAAPQLAWGMGVAALLLFSAVALRGMHSGDANVASVLPTVSGADPVSWARKDGTVLALFEGGAARKIDVVAEDGETRSYGLGKGQRFEAVLSNPNAVAQRFKIEVDHVLFAIVAVPGRHLAPHKAGSGTVTEFASALADAYGTPVVVKDLAVGSTLRWSFENPSARAAADAALDGKGSAILTDGNVLKIGS